MKLKWKQFFLTFAVLTVALAGCSSSDSTTPKEVDKDTFRNYSGNLRDVEFRQALRNSWVGTSETSALWAMSQNDQLDSASVPQVPPEVADDLLDTGKKIGGNLIKKGLGYVIDKVFGIQTKAEKEQDETNFINQTLLGIQHQVTTINENLTKVYTNQIQEMAQQAKDQIQLITENTDTDETILSQSSAATTFNADYNSFMSDINTNMQTYSKGPNWSVQFSELIKNGFVTANYPGIAQKDPQSTIVWYAYTMVDDLFGTPCTGAGSSLTCSTQWVTDYYTNAGNYMTQLKILTEANVISNYYAAGTRFSQIAYSASNLLQEAYTVWAFTLQLAAYSDDVKKFYTTPDNAPNGLYNGIDWSQVTPTNWYTQLKTLNSNIQTYLINADNYLQYIGDQFVTYTQGGTPSNYWDTASLVAAAGLSLDSQFMQNGCFPIIYVKNAKVNGTVNPNLDYLAAECNYNGDWRVLQLFIPTDNGTEGLTDISYLNGFGLIGDVDYQVISPYFTQGGTIASAGTCSSHYDNQCTSGFDDCHVGQTSMQLQPTPYPSYGVGFMKNNSSPDPTPTGTSGYNQRFTFATNYCQESMSDHSCTNQWNIVVFTPNGHLFQGDIQWDYCENETAHDMKNTHVYLSATQITEPTGYVNGTLSITDGSQVTDITFGGPSNNPAGQDGNTNPSWAEYGFGINVTDAPQPTASPYPLCSVNSGVSLLPIYSYTNSGVLTGTVTDATTITDSNNDTLTFASTYDSFTYKSNTWSRSTSSTTPPDGVESMQGVWQTGTGNNTQYLNIYCTN